ncbi:beta-galactosidase [Candidatus Symbiothrix dinenymphae]|nr:beta-galactosidase [Candidatus Symbiothrix dinenymphae]
MKRKLAFFILLGIFVNTGLYAQVSFGKAEKINSGWQFHLGDVPNAQAVGFDAAKWRTVNLPHDWSVEGTLNPGLAACTGWLPGGIGWYRKTIDIPQGKTGDRVYLYFEGVYNRSEVFVNGHSVGKRPNGYISFMYDATSYIEAGKPAVIAVRVDHSRSADSRWYTGSGIYRDVWLVTSDPVHIAQWGVFCRTKSADKGKAVLTVDTEVENGSDASINLTVVQQLFDANGKEVAAASKKISLPAKADGKVTSDMNVGKPLLWSVEKPNLYRLKTTIVQNGKTIDETETATGIRTFTFDPDKGFALNGKWMKLKGVCLHHDAGVLGSAVPREVWKRRLLTLQELGCNAVRMSHNPQAPDMYELCDELGLLVMDEGFDEWEFPKYKWLEAWTKGKPGLDGSYDFFEEWGERDLADMVRRNRKHVSIFAWSIGNEVDYPNDPYSHPALDSIRINQPQYGSYKPEQPKAERLGIIAKRLAAVVRKHDSSRPVTAGLASPAMSNLTGYPDALDIAGYNYAENRYGIDHKAYPKRVIYGSENGHSMSEWKAVRDNGHIFAQFLWTGVDYLGESKGWPSRGYYTALLDFGGFIKPRGYFRRALWSEKPVAYIGTYPAPDNKWALYMDAAPVWNYADGQNIRVVCYTNAAEAKLLLNGKETGATKKYDDNTGIIGWDIPYTAGTLEVVGMDAAGNKTCEYAIRTSGRSHTLTATADNSTVSADRGLAQITLNVVDENGVPVILSDDEVTCTIDGPARLLGLEASNNSDMGNYRDNVQRVFRGQLLAYIEATGEPGAITVKFTAPWLKPAELKLNSK